MAAALSKSGITTEVGTNGMDRTATRPETTGRQEHAQHDVSIIKRTFKDKLHGRIQEAEDAEIKAYRHQQSQDRKSLSIAMLIEGRPQAFVDFFYLTHSGAPPVAAAAAAAAQATDSPPGAAAPAAAPDDAGGNTELPVESLILLKTQLARADDAGISGNVEETFDAYRTLGRYFVQQGELRKAVFFYTKCLQVAKDSDWLEAQLEANTALGLVYEHLQQSDLAIACHERCLELAASSDLAADAGAALRSLVTVYSQRAAGHERAGEAEVAIAYLDKCLQAATMAGDADAAGDASYRLGLMHQALGRTQDALGFHQRLIELSQQTGDAGAEGRAHVAYAECQQQLGDLDGAVASLEAYLATSRGLDAEGHAIARCNLGNMCYQKGSYDQAVVHFEKFFELARTRNSRRMLDTARFNLGVARGAVRMSAYMDVIREDLPTLLRWKLLRVPFQRATTTS